MGEPHPVQTLPVVQILEFQKVLPIIEILLRKEEEKELSVRTDRHIHLEVRSQLAGEVIQVTEVKDPSIIILETRDRLIIHLENNLHPDLLIALLRLQADDQAVNPVVDHPEVPAVMVEEEDNCEFKTDTVSQLSGG